MNFTIIFVIILVVIIIAAIIYGLVKMAQTVPPRSCIETCMYQYPCEEVNNNREQCIINRNKCLEECRI